MASREPLVAPEKVNFVNEKIAHNLHIIRITNDALLQTILIKTSTEQLKFMNIQIIRRNNNIQLFRNRLSHQNPTCHRVRRCLPPLISKHQLSFSEIKQIELKPKQPHSISIDRCHLRKRHQDQHFNNTYKQPLCLQDFQSINKANIFILLDRYASDQTRHYLYRLLSQERVIKKKTTPFKPEVSKFKKQLRRHEARYQQVKKNVEKCLQTIELINSQRIHSEVIKKSSPEISIVNLYLNIASQFITSRQYQDFYYFRSVILTLLFNKSQQEKQRLLHIFQSYFQNQVLNFENGNDSLKFEFTKEFQSFIKMVKTLKQTKQVAAHTQTHFFTRENQSFMVKNSLNQSHVSPNPNNQTLQKTVAQTKKNGSLLDSTYNLHKRNYQVIDSINQSFLQQDITKNRADLVKRPSKILLRKCISVQSGLQQSLIKSNSSNKGGTQLQLSVSLSKTKNPKMGKSKKKKAKGKSLKAKSKTKLKSSKRLKKSKKSIDTQEEEEIQHEQAEEEQQPASQNEQIEQLQSDSLSSQQQPSQQDQWGYRLRKKQFAAKQNQVIQKELKNVIQNILLTKVEQGGQVQNQFDLLSIFQKLDLQDLLKFVGQEQKRQLDRELQQSKQCSLKGINSKIELGLTQLPSQSSKYLKKDFKEQKEKKKIKFMQNLRCSINESECQKIQEQAEVKVFIKNNLDKPFVERKSLFQITKEVSKINGLRFSFKNQLQSQVHQDFYLESRNMIKSLKVNDNDLYRQIRFRLFQQEATMIRLMNRLTRHFNSVLAQFFGYQS